MIKINSNSKGFTLIEVMIAMTIFAIGILGVAKLQITATGDNTDSRVMTESATLAIDVTEQLMNYLDGSDSNGIKNYDEATTSSIASDTSHFPQTIKASSDVEYQITRTISEDTPVKDLKQLNTTVTWNNRGEPATFIVNTYKSR